jgi:ubiquinone/menaquinone biosynthesis C-methylase UbiE
MENASVIDVGGGTAIHGRQLPDSATYFCLDRDPNKLRRARSSGVRVMQCDATLIALAPKSVDFALCIALAHHLPDPALKDAFQEISRVVRRQIVFVDPVARPRLSVGGLLWALDAGSYPRSEAQLLDAVADAFVCDHVETYEIYHRYLMCVASPRPVVDPRAASI